MDKEMGEEESEDIPLGASEAATTKRKKRK